MNKPGKQVLAAAAQGESNRLAQAILDFVSRVPDSQVGASTDTASATRQLSTRAARRAALAAGSLALPPGPLGWLTLLPELVAIWKIQGQLVSDIAAVYGRHSTLGREQMMWCLFRHTAAQAFRDLVVRMGDRLVFRRMSYGIAQSVARQIGVKLTQRTVGTGVARWLPVVGALGVGAYAYYDTIEVATTAIEVFEGEMALEDAGPALPGAVAGSMPAPLADPVPHTASVRHTLAGKVDAAVSGAAYKVVSATRKRLPGKRAAKPPAETP